MALKLPEGKSDLVGISALVEETQLEWLRAKANERNYSVSEFLRELLSRVIVATDDQAA